MSLPKDLSHYELERKWIPSQDMANLFHLKVICEEDGTPLRRESSKISQINLNQVFESSGPVEIEIGCGKGNFIQEYAQKFPKKLILGIDQEGAIAFKAAGRITKRPEIKNVKIIFGDAYFLFRDFLPENSISAFHMYFPDPWPKKRHKKRRLLSDKFLMVVEKVAIPNANFYWGTDHHGYHIDTLDVFENCPWLKCIEEEAKPTEGIETNFEKKYIKEGRPIYRSHWKIINSQA